MLAQQSLREGRLEEALAELQAQVRKEPADVRHRVFLFQLLAVMGRWERALSQLEAAGQLDPSALSMVYTYRQAIAAEAVRADVFAGRVKPPLIGEPAEWMAWLLEALRLTAAGEHAAAADLRARALEVAPAIGGELDGARFEWIADADSRLGPLLEVVLNGRYAWLPFQRLRALRSEPPADLRDLVWTPAFLTLETGVEVAALVPSRYPGAEAEQDSLRLSRGTQWRSLGDDTSWAGAGQRMLATDASEYPLLEVRSIRLEGDAGAGRPDAARDGPHG